MKDLKFEYYLKLAEDAIRSLESGDIELEESIKKYELGVKALKKCYEILERAKKKVEVICQDEKGNLVVKNFDEKETRRNENDNA